MNKNLITTEGTILESLGNTQFKVELDNNGSIIIVYLSGKLRMNFIKIIVGDKVKIEMSPYDLTKGRIISRITETKFKNIEKAPYNKKKNKK